MCRGQRLAHDMILRLLWVSGVRRPGKYHPILNLELESYLGTILPENTLEELIDWEWKGHTRINFIVSFVEISPAGMII